MMQLTIKQQLFAEYYEGNGTDAARKAGYGGNDNVLAQQARENLSNPQILEIIQQRHQNARAGFIADRERRQQFWTEVMLDTNKSIQVRLKASEILGRSCGDFVAKIEHSQVLKYQDILDEIAFHNEPLVKENSQA